MKVKECGSVGWVITAESVSRTGDKYAVVSPKKPCLLNPIGPGVLKVTALEK